MELILLISVDECNIPIYICWVCYNGILEMIFVMFSQSCLSILKVYLILDEFILAGELQETSKRVCILVDLVFMLSSSNIIVYTFLSAMYFFLFASESQSLSYQLPNYIKPLIAWVLPASFNAITQVTITPMFVLAGNHRENGGTGKTRVRYDCCRMMCED